MQLVFELPEKFRLLDLEDDDKDHAIIHPVPSTRTTTSANAIILLLMACFDVLRFPEVSIRFWTFHFESLDLDFYILSK